MGLSRVRYGPARSQVGNLWLPRRAAAPVPVPAIVLLHGGYWRARYPKVTMRPLAARLRQRGWAVWNVEYRRLGTGGGWPTTFLDVAAAVDHLGTIAGIDPTRVVTCGHSAGGLLALWAAGRARVPAGVGHPPPGLAVRGAVGLAPLVDLAATARHEVGNGPVHRLMGGDPQACPAAYAAASPFALLPLGVPHSLVHGLDDTLLRPRSSERYQAAAAAAGDDVRYLPVADVGHRSIVSPRAASWPVIEAELARHVGEA